MPSNLPLPALVIPDVHHRCDWAEAVIATEGADCATIIFTGDYFDHHGDTPLDTLHTARWLKKSLKDKRRTHLLGNHDVAYFARGVQTAEWSGWSDHKQEVFAGIFPPESFTELPLHLAATAGPWLLSHAGFCGGKLSPLVEHPTQALLHWADQARQKLQFHMQQHSPVSMLLGCGYNRGGDRPLGGLLWCDFDREFVPLPGLHQLCGHTPKTVRGCMLMPGGGQKRIVHLRELTQDAANRLNQLNIRSQNWCLDTHGHSWAKIYPTHLQLAWDEKRVDVPAPTVEDPTWPLLESFNLVPQLQDAPPLRVEWESVRRMFSETPTWPHLLRTLHVPEWPEQIPSAAKFEQALRTLQKHGTLTSAA
jgi:hypothetical protein